jgi:hypothetical protein
MFTLDILKLNFSSQFIILFNYFMYSRNLFDLVVYVNRMIQASTPSQLLVIVLIIIISKLNISKN